MIYLPLLLPPKCWDKGCVPSHMTLCPLYRGGNYRWREQGFPGDTEQSGSLCCGWVCLSESLLGGFCNQTGDQGSFIPFACFPSTSQLLLDCSLPLFWGLDGFWGFLGKVAGSKNLGRGVRAGQMSEPLLVSPPSATSACCSLEASGFMAMTRLWSLGSLGWLGQMSQSRHYVYS